MQFLKIIIRSIALILIATAILKVLEVTKQNAYFEEPDAVTGFLSNRQMLLLAAAFEAGVACYLLRSKSIKISSWVILWFCSIVAVYKIFLKMTYATVPCACLGIITKALKLSTHQAEVVTWSLLCLFSAAAAWCLYREKYSLSNLKT